MDSLFDGNLSRSDLLLNHFRSIQEKYKDEYPIILYDPNIKSKEKKKLKDLIGDKSFIHLFSDSNEAFKFAQSFGIISFLFILPHDYEEAKFIQKLQLPKGKYKRIMSDFEKELLFKDLLNEISEQMMKSFKVYVVFTMTDCLTKGDMRQDEDEVMTMCDLKEMAKEFRQEFTVIYYDPDINPESKQKLEEELEVRIEESNIFEDFGDLHFKIKNYTGPPYHLIMSRANKAKKIEEEIENFKDLLGLYVYCDKFPIEELKHEKVEAKKTLKELLPRIKEGFRTKSKLINTFPAFATNFDDWDKSLIKNTHSYLKGLSKIYNRRQAKEDFLKLARKIYQDEDKELMRFDKKYSEYNKEEILRWYSKNSPIYKLVNNCLRISTSDSILYCRLILKDMEQAIRDQYQQHSKDFNGIVYRGAFISSEEWEKLERNLGEEIEMSGFLSTTVSKKTAIKFFRGDAKNKIFITIIVPPLPELDEQGFADITQFSEFKEEQEILFNVRSRFRILEAKIDRIDIGRNARHLVLLYGTQLLRKHMTQHQPSIKITIQLPLEVKCNLCESKDRLFGFKQEENTEIRCLDCLIKNSIPKDTPLLALDSERDFDKDKEIVKCFKGRISPFDQKVNFPFYGYKCYNCQGSGKDRYYKWIALDGIETIEQCFECFEEKKKIESNILFVETNPYVLWQEEQKEEEKVESNFQSIEQRQPKDLDWENQGDIYLKAQSFNLYIEYGKRFAKRMIRKRWIEGEKLINLQKLGKAYKEIGQYQQALKFYKSSLDAWKEIFGEKNPYTCFSRSGLGEVYDSLGQYQKAIEYHEEALEVAKAAFGEKHDNIISIYNNIGKVYSNSGQYQKAQEYQRKAIDIAKSIYGEKHPQIALSYSNLAAVFHYLEDHHQAIKLYNEALDIFKNIYGEKNSHVAIIYDNLASVYNDLERMREAEDCADKYLKINKAIFGDQHPQTATSYHTLATVLASSSKNQQALEYFNKALQIRKAVYGEKHFEIAISYNAIGTEYTNLAEYQRALKYIKEAERIIKEIYGEKHPHIATPYKNLATLYEHLGDFQQAKWYATEALNLARVNFGGKHPITAASYHALSKIHSTLEDYQKALDYHKKGFDIEKSVYGDQHSKIASSYNSLASIYRNLGRDQEALEYQEKAFNMNKAIYGEDSKSTAKSMNDLGMVYMNLGKYQKALDNFTKSINITKVVHGEKSPQFASCKNNIASVDEYSGESQKALENFLMALEMKKATYGERNPVIISLYNNIAATYNNLSKHDKAIEYSEKAIEMTKIFFGEKHQEIAFSYNHLGTAHQALGDHQRALDYQKKALGILNWIYGEEHQHIAASYDYIASVYMDLDKPQEVIEYSKKAIAIIESKYGELHIGISSPYNHLAKVYFRQQNYQLVVKYLKKVINAVKASFGEKKKEIAGIYNNLAAAYHGLNDNNNKAECLKKALDIIKIAHGEKHQETGSLYSRLGDAYYQSKEYQLALENYKKALDITIAVDGEFHPKTAMLYKVLSNTFHSLGDKPNAEKCCHIMLSIHVKLKLNGGLK